MKNVPRLVPLPAVGIRSVRRREFLERYVFRSRIIVNSRRRVIIVLRNNYYYSRYCSWYETRVTGRTYSERLNRGRLYRRNSTRPRVEHRLDVSFRL